MTATATATDVVNEALQLIGGNKQPLVTGTAPSFDASPAGVAAANLYLPTVYTVGRRFGWDFARSNVSLTASGNAPPLGWAYEYIYPSNGIQVWQVTPSTLADPNNPLPVNWQISNAVVAGTQVRVIHTNVSPAFAVFNNAPAPSAWDSLFREAVVRELASAFAMALNGRPDTAQGQLEAAGAFAELGNERSG